MKRFNHEASILRCSVIQTSEWKMGDEEEENKEKDEKKDVKIMK